VRAAGYEVVFGEAASADLLVHLENDMPLTSSPNRVSLVGLAEGGVDVARYDQATLQALFNRLDRDAA